MTGSLVSDLFLGELRAADLLPYPFLAEERRELLAVVRETLGRFAKDRLDPDAIDRAHGIPAEVVAGLAEVGLFGLRIPEDFGGLDLDTTQYVRVGVDLSRHDGATAILSGGHSTIGIKALLLWGTPDQQARYLPRLASGELIAAFALSEPAAGSDAQGLRCTARRRADGAFVLDGEKAWITNGGLAGLVTVFARTPELPRADGRPSISCFLVERAHGFRAGAEEDKLGIRGSSTVPLLFEGVVVPPENLLGEPGNGFRMALEVLNGGRTGLAGNCLGAGRFLLEQASRYAEEREQFGRPIARFELIQQKLARMAQDLHALESMVFLTTGLMDRAGGQEAAAGFALESALCKIFGTEVLWAVVNDAVQIAGGNGFTTDYPFERMLRDARVNMIFEGTNEILRVMVGSAGAAAAARCAEERRSIATPGGRLAAGREAPQPLPVPASLQAEALALSMGVSELCVSTTHALAAHGAALRERQLVCAALADQALALYAQAAVLSRAATVCADGSDADEVLLARGACRRSARAARTAAHGLRDHDDALTRETAALVSRLGGLPGERL